MPRTSENGVFMSWPGPGIRPSAASSAVEPDRLDRFGARPCSVSSAFQA